MVVASGSRFHPLLVTAGVVALPLAVRCAATLPVIVGYVVPIGGVFLHRYQRLLVSSKSLPLPVLELMAVLVVGAVIKLLAALNPFQGDSHPQDHSIPLALCHPRRVGPT